MSNEVLIALIAMIGTTFASIVSAYVAIKTKNEVRVLHETVNSKMDKLLIAEKKVSVGEGVAQERAEQGVRDDAAAQKLIEVSGEDIVEIKSDVKEVKVGVKEINKKIE